MEITWFGRNCSRITERGHTSVVTDPHKPAKGAPELKLRADLVTVSHELSRHNVEQVKDHGYVISGPGEYEVGDLFVTGIPLHVHDAEKDRVLDNIASIDVKSFDIQLGEFGYFGHHHIFYIALNIVPIELLSLHKQLCRILSPCHFKPPRAFKPHVRLFRGVRSPPFCEPLETTLRWHVDAVYVERSLLSKTGAHYTTLKKQPLAPVDQ